MSSISVVIPTYHRYEVLEKTVNDLLNQIVPPNQIIVVDNTDSAVRTEPSYLKSTPTTECIYVSSSKVGRVNVARNEGLEKATSTFVLYFDDDMDVPEDCIKKFLQVHEEGWEAVTGSILEEGRMLDTAEIIPHRPIWSVLRTQHGSERGTTIGVPSCLISMRTSKLREIGGFDEAYIYNYDDYDLGIRLWRAGCITVRDPLIFVHHLKTPSGGGRVNSDAQRKLNKYTAKYYFLVKHFNKRATQLEFVTDIVIAAMNLRWKPIRLFKELMVFRKAFSAYSSYDQPKDAISTK